MSERLVVWHRWLPPKADEARADVAAWQRSVATRFRVAGGTVLGAIGGSIAASFDPADVVDALEMALDLLVEADEQESIEIAIGVALGELIEVENAVVGSAIERAQLLASRARAGELVIDAGVRSLAAPEFLFGRQVATGAGSARGTSIDRTYPRRSEHAAAIAALAPTPLPPVVESVRREVEEVLAAGASRTFVLRGPVGAGATELIGALERALAPSSVLRIGAAPGGVVPLASLRLALVQGLGTPSKIEKAYPGLAGAVLAHVAAGALVPRRTLAEALVAMVEALGKPRPWVVLSPMSLVDGATLGALLEARAMGADFVLFGRFPVDLPLPRPLAGLGEKVCELTLPPLKMADARAVAEAILGPATADEVARRVAVLGGDTVLGVVEAARTLIATGELVRDGDAFVWRVGPRQGAHAIGTEALLAERLDLLDPDSRRVLEAACVVPDGWPAERLGTVAALDGIGEAAFARSLGTLSREALLTGRAHPRPASSLLRWHLLGRIPAGRFTELHRFVADVMRAHAPSSPPLRAELGYYLYEGGLDAQARPHLTYAVQALVQAGYARAARQLSGWLAQRDEARAQEAAGAIPSPPTGEAFEESPPSSEHFLDELLEEATEEQREAFGRAAPSKGPAPRAAAVGGAADAPSERGATAAPSASAGTSTAPSASTAPSTGTSTSTAPSTSTGTSTSTAPSTGTSTSTAPSTSTGTSTSTATTTSTGTSTGTSTAPSASAEPSTSTTSTSEGTSATTSESTHGRSDAGTSPAADDAMESAAIDAELDALLPPPDDSAADGADELVAEPTKISPPPLRPLARDAVRALRARDFAALERAVRRAAAEGRGLGAIARVRAVAELARGDLEAARRHLRESRASGKEDPGATARHHVAEALLEMCGGNPTRGVRAALAALAISRRLADARGEAAALRVLSACYRALGRDDQARRLELGAP